MDMENIYKIQIRLVELAQRVQDGRNEPLAEELSQLKTLYGNMTGDKDWGLRHFVFRLVNARMINKNQNSSWYLLRMITDLISDVQFNKVGMMYLWDSWLREEYEELMAEKYNPVMLHDLVPPLTHRLRKSFSDSVQVLEHIDRVVGQGKYGISKGEDRPIIEAKTSRKNVAFCPPKTLEREPEPKPMREMPNVVRPSKQDLQRRKFQKLLDLQKDLIPALRENNEEEATQKLSNLKKLYNDIDIDVEEAEGVEDLTREIERYMQTNGISSSRYFLWVLFHVIVEIRFSKMSLEYLWMSVVRGKFKSLVMQYDITDPQFAELISMVKLVGRVYYKGGCTDIVTELEGIGTPKYGRGWIHSNCSLALFPDTRDRLRYISIARGNNNMEGSRMGNVRDDWDTGIWHKGLSNDSKPMSEDDSIIKLGDNTSATGTGTGTGTVTDDEVTLIAVVPSRKRNTNSNPINHDLLDKPLIDPLTVKVPQPSSSSSSWWPNAKSNPTSLITQSVPNIKRSSESISSNSSSSANTGTRNNNEPHPAYGYEVPEYETPLEKAKLNLERRQIQKAKKAVVRINGNIKEHYLPLDFSDEEFVNLIFSPNFISLSTKPFGGYMLQCVEHYN